MTVSFNTYKTSTVQKLYNRRLFNRSDCDYILDSKTKYCFIQRVNDCFDDRMEKNSEAAGNISKRGGVKPEEISLVKTLQKKIENLTISLTKIFSKKDTNPEVLDLKKQIKSEFGTKNLYLDNNKAFAKKIQKSLRILKENNLPLPDEIIVNSILGFSMGISDQNRKTMVLNPGVADTLYFSTESPLHMIIHEGIHIGQPGDVTLRFKKMPERFKETIDNLSLYAGDNFILEVHAELKAKQLLCPDKFTEDEQKALEYIEDLFKQAV